MSCILMLNGRIGKIEKNLTKNGITVVKVSIASSNDEKDKDNNYKTEWTDITAYGKKAEYIYNYSHKGDIVSVIARKQTEKVTDANGNNRYFTNYIIGEAFYCFQILHRKNNSLEVNTTNSNVPTSNKKEEDVNLEINNEGQGKIEVKQTEKSNINNIPDIDLDSEIPY